MKNCYRDKTNLLEQAIAEECERINESASDRWVALFEDSQNDLDLKRAISAESRKWFLGRLQLIEVEEDESTRQSRMRLESRKDALQIELQQMKAKVELEAERLNHECQALEEKCQKNAARRFVEKNNLSKMHCKVAKRKEQIQELNRRFERESTKLAVDLQTLNLRVAHFNQRTSESTTANRTKVI